MLKEKPVGSALGRSLLEFSRLSALHSISARNPEKAGFVANCIIADRQIAGVCPPGGKFIDVDAHIGSVMATPGDDLYIIAVEAYPNKAAAFERDFRTARFSMSRSAKLPVRPSSSSTRMRQGRTRFSKRKAAKSSRSALPRLTIPCLMVEPKASRSTSRARNSAPSAAEKTDRTIPPGH